MKKTVAFLQIIFCLIPIFGEAARTTSNNRNVASPNGYAYPQGRHPIRVIQFRNCIEDLSCEAVGRVGTSAGAVVPFSVRIYRLEQGNMWAGTGTINVTYGNQAMNLVWNKCEYPIRLYAERINAVTTTIWADLATEIPVASDISQCDQSQVYTALAYRWGPVTFR